MTSDPRITAHDIATHLGVSVPSGLAQTELRGVTTLDAAGPQDVSYLAREKFADAARQSRAGLLLVSEKIAVDHPAVLRVPDALEALVRVLPLFHPEPTPRAEIHPSAVVNPSATIGEHVFLGPNVVVEAHAVLADGVRVEANCFIGAKARLGKGAWLSPNVVVQHGCEIGARVRVHSGAVIGADGFRIEIIGGRPQKVPQVGRVVVEEDVEIGANCTIDRASLTETRIGARTKMDNLVHVAHNCVIGSDCIIVACTAIAGSVRIGRGVVIAGGVGIKDNVTIGDGVRIGGRSGIQHDIPAGAEVIGNPAINVHDYARFTTFYRNFSRHWKVLRRVLQREAKESND